MNTTGSIRDVGTEWDVALCLHCKRPSLWLSESMIYPTSGQAPLPNEDLPGDIRNDYEEAREILGRSPRAAARWCKPPGRRTKLWSAKRA